MPEISCRQCNKSFRVSPSRLTGKKRIYCCSKRCSNLRKQVTQAGENNPFYGKKHSQEVIEKNRQAHMGQVCFWRGKHLPQKVRKKIANSLKGNNNRFKGGQRNFRGYIGVYSPNHPFKDKNNCVREHRLVMEKHLGRFLEKQEVIHHINGNKADNRLKNLMLFSSHYEHMLYHGKTGTIKGRPSRRNAKVS